MEESIFPLTRIIVAIIELHGALSFHPIKSKVPFVEVPIGVHHPPVPMHLVILPKPFKVISFRSDHLSLPLPQISKHVPLAEVVRAVWDEVELLPLQDLVLIELIVEMLFIVKGLQSHYLVLNGNHQLTCLL